MVFPPIDLCPPCPMKSSHRWPRVHHSYSPSASWAGRRFCFAGVRCRRCKLAITLEGRVLFPEDLWDLCLYLYFLCFYLSMNVLISVSIYQFFLPFIYLRVSVCLTIYLFLSIHLYICPYSYIYMSIWVSIYRPIHLPFCLYLPPSSRPSLSVRLSVCRSAF